MYYNYETSKEENYFKFRQLCVFRFKTKFFVEDTEIANDLTTDLIIRLEESLKKSRTGNLDPEFCGKAAFYTFDRYMRTIKKEQGEPEKKNKEEIELEKVEVEEGLKEEERVTKSKRVSFENIEDLGQEKENTYFDSLDIYFIKKDLTKLSENNGKVFDLKMKGYNLTEIAKITGISIKWVEELNKRNEEFLKKNKSRYL